RAVRAAAHAVVARAERAADDHRDLRHPRARDGRDELRAVLRNAAALGVLADHEAGDVLEEEEGEAAPIADLDEVRALERRLREQNAIVREDADRPPLDARERADERRAVALLELVDLRAVDDAREELADVVLPAHVLRHDAVELLGRVERRLVRFDVRARARGLAPRD